MPNPRTVGPQRGWLSAPSCAHPPDFHVRSSSLTCRNGQRDTIEDTRDDTRSDRLPIFTHTDWRSQPQHPGSEWVFLVCCATRNLCLLSRLGLNGADEGQVSRGGPPSCLMCRCVSALNGDHARPSLGKNKGSHTSVKGAPSRTPARWSDALRSWKGTNRNGHQTAPCPTRRPEEKAQNMRHADRFYKPLTPAATGPRCGFPDRGRCGYGNCPRATRPARASASGPGPRRSIPAR